jgi:hypothetical protein
MAAVAAVPRITTKVALALAVAVPEARILLPQVQELRIRAGERVVFTFLAPEQVVLAGWF